MKKISWIERGGSIAKDWREKQNDQDHLQPTKKGIGFGMRQ